MKDTSKDIIRLAYKAAEDKKAEDIRILNIGEISVLGDYFLICNGNSQPQVDAITDNIIETLLKEGIKPGRIEGQYNSGWVLIDCHDVIIHVFTKEERLFYDLERLWRDAGNESIDTL